MSNKFKKICEHLSQKLNVKKSMKSQQLRKNLTKMIAKDMLSISSENQALYLLQMSRMALNLKW